jgi:hypothetical protein
MAALVLVIFLVFGRSVGHFFDTAALLAAVTVAAGGAAIGAAITLAAFLSTRRRRAAAGGCVSCRLRCQHAITEQPRPVWLVSTADGRPARPSGSPGPAALPAAPAGRAAPRWPDRPVHRTGPAAHPVQHIHDERRRVLRS